MKPRVAVWSTAVLWLSCVGVAGAADEPVPVTPAASEIVCRHEKPTGSHVRVKICRTRAQIQAEAEATRRAMNAVKTRGHEGNMSPVSSD